MRLVSIFQSALSIPIGLAVLAGLAQAQSSSKPPSENDRQIDAYAQKENRWHAW